MTLIVETGSGVTGANTYISLDNFQVHCDDRNRDYSGYTDEQQEAALIMAGDYLNSLPWKGVRTGLNNTMQWPRYGTEVGGSSWNQLQYPSSTWVGVLDADGWYLPIDAIPTQVIQAQCESAWLILTGKDMEPSLDRGGQIIREKYDVIEFQYAPGAPPTTEFKAVSNRLVGLLKNNLTVEIVRA
jgi:hypothetical protein